MYDIRLNYLLNKSKIKNKEIINIIKENKPIIEEYDNNKDYLNYYKKIIKLNKTILTKLDNKKNLILIEDINKEIKDYKEKLKQYKEKINYKDKAKERRKEYNKNYYKTNLDKINKINKNYQDFLNKNKMNKKELDNYENENKKKVKRYEKNLNDYNQYFKSLNIDLINYDYFFNLSYNILNNYLINISYNLSYNYLLSYDIECYKTNNIYYKYLINIDCNLLKHYNSLLTDIYKRIDLKIINIKNFGCFFNKNILQYITNKYNLINSIKYNNLTYKKILLIKNRIDGLNNSFYKLFILRYEIEKPKYIKQSELNRIEIKKKSYNKNKEKINKNNQEYKKNNAEKIKKYNSSYYEKHKEELQQKRKERYKKQKEKEKNKNKNINKISFNV